MTDSTGAGRGQAIHFAPAGSSAILAEKRRRLSEVLRGLGRTLVAYSGGVDSAYLLAEAHRALSEGALGVIARSPSLPAAELEGALALAAEHGLPVRVVDTNEMEREAYRRNDPDRCYHCKTELFEHLVALAGAEGWRAIAYGAVTDDLGDDRPGMGAAKELEIRAPMLEAGLSKIEVRALARQMGLRVWDKPQSACLASRIPHGMEVTVDKLRQVESAEAWICRKFGLRVVRVRHFGQRAKVETELSDVPRLLAALPELRSGLLTWGFEIVEVDPAGYRRPDPLPIVNMEVT
ncbi:MAG TPA: ATP-dependent sacrificial sulfur transferase LarE [Candidatus Eisenbacteria bacterium]|nr:ATP-dependent sacrificial sulfur transferase LarE [Candidatus Eisenbacteria bacterium]